MNHWEIAIQAFDEDLRLRMVVIRSHERTGIDFDSSYFTRRALGFPSRVRFCVWRDHTKEWRERNRERVNAVERIRRKKSPEKFREISKRYYHSHIEEVRLRGRLKFSGLTREQRDLINLRRREQRALKNSLDKNFSM